MGLLSPSLRVSQPLSPCESGFYLHSPPAASPSLHIPVILPTGKSFCLPAGDGRVTKSKCQPGLSEPPFDGELSSWRAKPHRASYRGLTCRDWSPSFSGSPPVLPATRTQRAAGAHLITCFLISVLALVSSFKCSKVILKNTSFCFHFALAWPSHKSGLRQSSRGLG